MDTVVVILKCFFDRVILINQVLFCTYYANASILLESGNNMFVVIVVYDFLQIVFPGIAIQRVRAYFIVQENEIFRLKLQRKIQINQGKLTADILTYLGCS